MSDRHRSWLSAGLDRIGLTAETKYRLRWVGHRAGIRRDELVRTLDAAERLGRTATRPVPPARAGETVLVWSIRGGALVSTIEGLLAKALHLRGVPTLSITCDGVLSGCENRIASLYQDETLGDVEGRRLCGTCRVTSQRLASNLRVPRATLESLLSPGAMEQAAADVADSTVEEIFALERDGTALGPIIHSSVIRFFLRSELDRSDPRVILQSRRYAASAIVMLEAVREAIRRYRPRSILSSHGVYVSWGVMAEVAKAEGVPLLVWGQGFRPGTMILGKNATYFEEMQTEPSSVWDGLDLDADGRRERVESYLASRWTPGTDAIELFSDSVRDPARIRRELAIEPGRRVVSLFPNVTWDAQVFHRNIAFPSVAAWVLASIDTARQQTDVQFVIRAHPMESQTMAESDETMVGIIAERAGPLPDNVRIVPSTSAINSYTLAEMSDAVAVHASQMGLEAATRGLPVIVTGGCPYRAKGFTKDVSDAADYSRAIDAVVPGERISVESRERALRYAYHYYFRRPIQLGLYETRARSRLEELRLTSLADMERGENQGLDTVLDALLEDGRLFVD